MILSEFSTGQGSIDRRLAVLGPPLRLFAGVTVKADLNNSAAIFVGPSTLRVDNGYKLDAGEEVGISIEDLAKIFVTSDTTATQKQTVTLPDGDPADEFILSFHGEDTEPIMRGSAEATVQAALEALDSIGAGNVTVVGNGPYVIEFIGDFAGYNQELIWARAGTLAQQSVEISPMVLGGTYTLTFDGETTAPLDFDADAAAVKAALEVLVDAVDVTGGPANAQPLVITFLGELAFEAVDLLIGVGQLLSASLISPAVEGGPGQDERQNVIIPADTTGGTFTLTFDGETTAPIAFDADAAAVKDALEALDNIDLVDVTGGPGPLVMWHVDFQGSLAETDVPTMEIDDSTLTGSATKEVTVVEVAAGVLDTVNAVQTQDASRDSLFTWIAQ